MSEQKPSIGRIVHYLLDGPESIPAVIIRVEPDGERCLLFVMYVDGYYTTLAPYSETPALGHWNWPPRV